MVTIKPVQFFYLRKQIEPQSLFCICTFSGDDNEQDSLVYHDVFMIKTLSKILNKLDSKIRLLVRPYPLSKYDKSINTFKDLTNVKFDSKINEDQNNQDHFSTKILKLTRFV